MPRSLVRIYAFCINASWSDERVLKTQRETCFHTAGNVSTATRKEMVMKSNAYQFSIGNFSCAIVNDGTFAYPSPAQLFFDGAPEERLAQALQAQEIELATWTEFVSSYPTVLVNTGAHRVLIDTGAGGF